MATLLSTAWFKLMSLLPSLFSIPNIAPATNPRRVPDPDVENGGGPQPDRALAFAERVSDSAKSIALSMIGIMPFLLVNPPNGSDPLTLCFYYVFGALALAMAVLLFYLHIGFDASIGLAGEQLTAVLTCCVAFVVDFILHIYAKLPLIFFGVVLGSSLILSGSLYFKVIKVTQRLSAAGSSAA